MTVAQIDAALEQARADLAEVRARATPAPFEEAVRTDRINQLRLRRAGAVAFADALARVEGAVA